MYFHPKLKYLFSTHQRLSFAWIIILSTLWLACDPDEGTEAPKSENNIAGACGNNATQLLANKNQVGDKQAITYSDEPKFSEQWYLHNTNIKGLDINIVPAWAKGYGNKPVAIAILDAGIDTSHPDLTNSVLVTGFGGYDAKIAHGTSVAGLIAARDNNMGMIGVVPKANIYSFSVTANQDRAHDTYIPNAFCHSLHREIAVYSASIGHSSSVTPYSYQPIDTNAKNAMDKVTRDGFNGKGSSIVFAAGNILTVVRNDGYLNHHAVIGVNPIRSDGLIPGIAKKFGHSKGLNLWIAAPTGSYTTNNGGGYTDDFDNTSSATPLVSGAIGLLRSEFPALTYRDVKLILAESATKYDKDNKANYQKSGVFYSNSSTEQRYSTLMGFGLLNVSQALTLAQNWKLLPPMKVDSYTANNINIGNSTEYTHSFNANNTIAFIESLTLDIILPKEDLDQWDLTINSPDGREYNISYYGKPTEMTLLFNNFLGSSAAGQWKLQISRPDDQFTKVINKLTWTFRGH